MSANERNIKLRFTGDAAPVRMTVAELRAQLGADFDKVVAQAKFSSAAISQVGNSAAAEVRRQVEAAERAITTSQLSVKQQQSAVEALQRQRSSALLSITKAMETDVSKSAAQAEKAHGLTDKLIADSQRAIASAEQSAAGAAGAVERVGARLATATEEAASFGGQLASIGEVLTGPFGVAALAAAVAIGAVGAAAIKFVNDTAQAGDELENLSQKTNFEVETLSALKNLSETYGASLSTVVSSLAIFNKNLGQGDDGAKKITSTLEKLNVVQADQETTLRRVFKALYDLRGSYQQNEYAQALFGKGAKEVLAIINQTHGDLDGAIARYRELGTLISSQAAGEAKDYERQLVQVRQQIEAVERTIGNQLLPTAQRTLAALSQSLKENQREFQEWSVLAVDVGGATATLLEPFAEMEKWLIRVARAATPVIDVLKGLKDFRDYMNGPSVGATIDTSVLSQKNRGLYVGQGVNVPEGLRYDQSKADATYNASQYAGAATFVKQQEEAAKKAEGEAKKARAEAERESERQAGVVRRLADEYAKLSLQVEHFNDSQVEQRIAEMRLNSGVETLTGQRRKEAEALLALNAAEMRNLDVRQKIKEAQEKAKKDEEELRDLRDNASDKVRAALSEQYKLLVGQETELGKVNKIIKEAEVLGAIDARTAAWLRQLAVLNDVAKEIEKTVPSPIENPMIPYGKGQEKGPFVDPREFEKEFGEPPVPNLDFHKKVIQDFRDFAVGSFEGVGQGFAGMLAGFLAGGPASEMSFKQMAKSVVASLAAQALVEAAMETARGVAELAMAASNPFTAPQHIAAAHLHFASAAAFGVVGGVAAGVALAIPGGKGAAGAAFAQNSSAGSASGSGGGSNAPRDREFVYGSPLSTPASFDNQPGSRGTVFARVISEVRDAIKENTQTLAQFKTASPDDVLMKGAATNAGRRAIGAAVKEHSDEAPSFNRHLLQNLGFGRT